MQVCDACFGTDETFAHFSPKQVSSYHAGMALDTLRVERRWLLGVTSMRWQAVLLG